LFMNTAENSLCSIVCKIAGTLTVCAASHLVRSISSRRWLACSPRAIFKNVVRPDFPTRKTKPPPYPDRIGSTRAPESSDRQEPGSRSRVLLILRGSRPRNRGVSFTHVRPALRCSVISGPSKMIDLRVQIHPDNRIARATCFGLRLRRKLAGACRCGGLLPARRGRGRYRRSRSSRWLPWWGRGGSSRRDRWRRRGGS
jgi:hypothetical protein